MSRHAAIDLGSHSVKLLVADLGENGRWTRVHETVTVTGLGLGDPAADGLAESGRVRTRDALESMLTTARHLEAESVVAVGTAVLRIARDADAFVAEIATHLGLAVEVISGEEEARLTYLGAVAALPATDDTGLDLACDIGGRSTEFAWGDGPALIDRQSLPMGTISLTRAHGLDQAATDQILAATRQTIADALDTLGTIAPPRRLILIGATPGTVLALHDAVDIADSAAIDGRPLLGAMIEAQITQLAPLSTDERRLLPGLHAGRAPVILAGALLCVEIARRWAPTVPTVSAAGLRDGLLSDRIGPRS